MRQTALETLRRLLRDQLSIRWPDPGTDGTGLDASNAPEPLVADGGARSESGDGAHVHAVPDGAGCTEIWEHLSERRGGDVDHDA